jgi:transposase InsO family protein
MALKQSMDGKGRAIDNIFIERFWRSYKYEYLYLNAPNVAEKSCTRKPRLTLIFIILNEAIRA